MLPLSLEVRPLMTSPPILWLAASFRQVFGQHETGLWLRAMEPAIS